MKTVFLSLGSNLGNRSKNIENAINALSHDLDVPFTIVNCAALYVAEPWPKEQSIPLSGGQAQDMQWFLNTVLQGQTDVDPKKFLKKIHEIEKLLGRTHGPSAPSSPAPSHYTPRTIDIDILFWGDEIIETGDLMIPHPHIQDRFFVLMPLAELAPKFIHPVLKKTVWELLKDCTDTSIVRPHVDVSL